MFFFFFADIEAEVDERKGGEMLESKTSALFLEHGLMCIFTVVSNIFIGLECTEHTCYDVILINHNMKHGINAFEFLRILRTAGALTPVILVYDTTTSSILSQQSKDDFSCLLEKPFSAATICAAILNAIQHMTNNLTRKSRSTQKTVKRDALKAQEESAQNITDCFEKNADFDSYYLINCHRMAADANGDTKHAAIAQEDLEFLDFA